MPRLIVACTLLVAIAFAQSSQGTELDPFEFSRSYAERTADKVYRQRIQLNFFGENEAFAWYQVPISADDFEYVLVDTQMSARKTLFLQSEIASLLAEQLPPAMQLDSPRPLRLRFNEDASEVTFIAVGRSWRWNQDTRQLNLLEESLAANDERQGLPPLTTLRPSESGGESTPIEIRNQLDRRLRVYWIDTSGARQPYGEIDAGGSWSSSTYAGHVWLLTDEEDNSVAAFRADFDSAIAIVDETVPVPQRGRRGGLRRGGRGRGEARQNLSPDGQFRVDFVDDNVVLRRAAGDEQVQLTSDGTEEDGFAGPVWWAPNSKHFVVMRTRRAKTRQVTLVEAAPREQLQPITKAINYAKPGDELDLPRPYLFHVDDSALADSSVGIKIENALFNNPFQINRLQWDEDSKEFFFVYNQRGHQVLRLIAVDAQSAQPRVVIDETSPTFVCYSHKFYLERLSETKQWIWMTERDGWNHLVLIDSATGNIVNKITAGEWVVLRVERIDHELQQLWLVVGGIHAGEDPYHEHLIRVNFDGTGLTYLTGNGTDVGGDNGMHRWEYSPAGRWLIDVYSRVDLPPVTLLRDAESGDLVCTLERADWSELLASSWQPPQRFVAKGRDGVTDIHGIIIRPTNFDPTKKYPVLEAIYAGPQDSFTPKSFGLHRGLYEMAELGFIVIKLDGMGTSNRSKAFHDVCWQNLADSGFPDRIAWLRAAAEQHPQLDLSRVGLYGGSAGGQSALAALLFHGDFYHAAAADCGCHDNRMDKIWWNEQWMGWPIGPHYEANSNVTHAHRLQGKLLLTVGAMDSNVDPASTMQVVEALIRADKDFELIVFPSGGHGIGSGGYGTKRMQQFFIRELGTPQDLSTTIRNHLLGQ